MTKAWPTPSLDAFRIISVSEEFVPICLASKKLGDEQKREIADAIVATPKGQLTPGRVKMSPLTKDTSLKDRDGAQSRHFFTAL